MSKTSQAQIEASMRWQRKPENRSKVNRTQYKSKTKNFILTKATAEDLEEVLSWVQQRREEITMIEKVNELLYEASKLTNDGATSFFTTKEFLDFVSEDEKENLGMYDGVVALVDGKIKLLVNKNDIIALTPEYCMSFNETVKEDFTRLFPVENRTEGMSLIESAHEALENC